MSTSALASGETAARASCPRRLSLRLRPYRSSVQRSRGAVQQEAFSESRVTLQQQVETTGTAWGPECQCWVRASNEAVFPPCISRDSREALEFYTPWKEVAG